MSALKFVIGASDFVKEYLPFIILVLALIIVIIVIVFFVKKSKKPTEYTPDEIDRSVDDAARKKAAERKEQATETEKCESCDGSEPVEEKAEEKEEHPGSEPVEEKIEEKEEHQETKSVEEAMASGEDEQEEITFEAEDVEEQPAEVKDEIQPKRKTVSYRILYDKETKTWEIRKDNAKRVIRRVKTKKEALEIAQELSAKQDLNLVVHKKDGKFQKIRK